MQFERHLEHNIFSIKRDLLEHTYRHQEYDSFYVRDPKVRRISKACVADRLVHQALYLALTPVFEPRFIEHLYSCRVGKGTHRGVEALRRFSWKVSNNLTRECWGLKCDIRRFYDSVDHDILIRLVKRLVLDENTRWLVHEIVSSFHTKGHPGKGMPIGNLTSQLFTNLYLNELDHFIKHELRCRFYLRYADDFLLLSHDKGWLESLIPTIKEFLSENLALELHPNKVSIRPLHQGIDFLGYVTLPHHTVLRTKTKRRMLRKLSERLDLYLKGEVSEETLEQSLASYCGVLSHAHTYELQLQMLNQFASY